MSKKKQTHKLYNCGKIPKWSTRIIFFFFTQNKMFAVKKKLYICIIIEREEEGRGRERKMRKKKLK